MEAQVQGQAVEQVAVALTSICRIFWPGWGHTGGKKGWNVGRLRSIFPFALEVENMGMGEAQLFAPCSKREMGEGAREGVMGMHGQEEEVGTE